MTWRRPYTQIERREHADSLQRTHASSAIPGGASGGGGGAGDESWLGPIIDVRDAPPGSPATGARYIVGCAPTGAGAGRRTQIAEWNATEWAFTIPVDGDTLWNMSESWMLTYIDLNDAASPFSGGTAEVFWMSHHLVDGGHSLLPLSVVDRVTVLPAASGVPEYSVYLMTSGGLDKHLAIRICDTNLGPEWTFIAPREGHIIQVEDENQHYVYDGATNTWRPFAIHIAGLMTIGDIGDVDLTGIQDGDILLWFDGVQCWKPAAPGGGGGPIELDDLTDVTITTPGACDVIKRNGGNTEWKNGRLSINCLLEVLLGTPSNGEVFFYNGTNWIDRRLTCNDVDNASTASGSTVCDALSGHESRIDSLESTATSLDSRVDALEAGGSVTGSAVIIAGAFNESGIRTTGSGFTISGSGPFVINLTTPFTGTAMVQWIQVNNSNGVVRNQMNHVTNRNESALISSFSTPAAFTFGGGLDTSFTFFGAVT